MNERYQRQWEALGAQDPFWAVRSNSRMKDGRCLRDAGMTIADVEEEHPAGPAFVSYRYFSVQR